MRLDTVVHGGHMVLSAVHKVLPCTQGQACMQPWVRA
jgi:hypothetical protein